VTEKSDPGGAPTSAASVGDNGPAKYSNPATAPRSLHGRNPLNVSGSKSWSNSTGVPIAAMACCHAEGLGIADRRRYTIRSTDTAKPSAAELVISLRTCAGHLGPARRV
jgi:hypothetical protein